MNLSTVTFEGNLAAVPQLTQTTGTKTSVAEAVVLVNRRHHVALPGGAEEWVDDEPTRYLIKAPKALGEHLAGLPKGATVLVGGTVVTDKWTDPTSGQKRTQDVIVDAIGASLRFAGVEILPRPTARNGTV